METSLPAWTGYLLLVFTPVEWHALGILALVVTAVTETTKRVFFIKFPKVRKKRAVYATATLVAITVSGAGALTTTGDVRPWVWLVAATTLGPLTNFLHWASLGVIAWKAPGLATALKGKN